MHAARTRARTAFQTFEERNKHEQTDHIATQGARYLCRYEQCGIFFAAPGDRTKHERKHGGRPLERCAYFGCGAAYETISELNDHLQLHSRPFRCKHQGCNFNTPFAGSLKSHVADSHAGHASHTSSTTLSPSPVASVSGETPPSPHKSQAARQAAKVARQQQQAAAASAATASTATATTTTTAAVTVTAATPDERTFCCRHKDCSLTFNKMGDRKRHEDAHAEPKPFLCTECDASFFAQRDLVVHTKHHKKAHVCPSQGCGRAFAHRFKMSEHFAKKHPNGPSIEEATVAAAAAAATATAAAATATAPAPAAAQEPAAAASATTDADAESELGSWTGEDVPGADDQDAWQAWEEETTVAGDVPTPMPWHTLKNGNQVCAVPHVDGWTYTAARNETTGDWMFSILRHEQ